MCLKEERLIMLGCPPHPPTPLSQTWSPGQASFSTDSMRIQVFSTSCVLFFSHSFEQRKTKSTDWLTGHVRYGRASQLVHIHLWLDINIWLCHTRPLGQDTWIRVCASSVQRQNKLEKIHAVLAGCCRGGVHRQCYLTWLSQSAAGRLKKPTIISFFSRPFVSCWCAFLLKHACHQSSNLFVVLTYMTWEAALIGWNLIVITIDFKIVFFLDGKWKESVYHESTPAQSLFFNIFLSFRLSFS